MKFCPECGNPVEGYKFCPNCGYSIANQEPTEQPQPVDKPASPSPAQRSRKTDKVGPLEIDRHHRTYRINGARKAKGSSGLIGGAIKGTAKATLAVSTMGLSLIPSLVKKDKNDTDWYSFEVFFTGFLIKSINTTGLVKSFEVTRTVMFKILEVDFLFATIPPATAPIAPNIAPATKA